MSGPDPKQALRLRTLLITLFVSACLLSVAVAPGFSAATVTVKESEVRQVITDFLKNRLNGLDLEINVRKIGYTGDLSLAAGKVSYEVVAPRQWEGWGAGNLALIVRVDDRVEKNIPVRVEVEALANMLVTTRPLERGEVISTADVTVQKRDMAGIGGRICRTADEVVGKRVRTGLRANVPVRNDSVEKVPLIRSGQTVTILVENEVIRLTATGQAREAGAEGDMVMVRNLNSQKYVPARVVDATTVRVEY